MVAKKETILSGIQPSGKLHIGNYLGAVRNFLELQQAHRCFFMIADLHSITEDYDPALKQKQIQDLVADYLAAGLDPKKSTIFVQSEVRGHTELGWIFNTLTPISYLQRMTQFKDKSSRQAHNINTGLFTYPVLQAADILLYRATAVPVGVDQDQHLELTREIARLFNNKFGDTFTEPKTLHSKIPKVMSLLDPEKKMSKSLGEAHCIFLDEEHDAIEQKMKKAVTDTGDGSGRGARNLLDLLAFFGDDKTTTHFKKQLTEGSIRYAELKSSLASAIASHFEQFRKNKKKITASKIKAVLTSGARQAQKIADKTVAEVYKKTGLR